MSYVSIELYFSRVGFFDIALVLIPLAYWPTLGVLSWSAQRHETLDDAREDGSL
jgi:hypothetical protein